MALHAVNFGEIIKHYPDDLPYASKLVMAYVNDINAITLTTERRPLHVVYSVSPEGICYLITAYWPDTNLWNEDFKAKK